MTGEGTGGRDEPFWRWAPVEPRCALAADGEELAARELARRAERVAAGLAAAGLTRGSTARLDGLDIASAVTVRLAAERLGATATVARPEDAATGPSDDLWVTGGDPRDAMLAYADLLAFEGTPPDDPAADAAARSRGMGADVIGLTPGADVTVVLPRLHAFTLSVVAAVLHSRRGARLAGDLATVPVAGGDLLGTRATIEAVLAAATDPAAWQGVQRVVAYGGRGMFGDLRARLAERIRTDVLVAVSLGAHGIESLDAPAGSSVGGFWSRAGRRDEPAVITAMGDVITAGVLLDRVVALAGALAARYDVPGGTVVAVLDDGADMVTAVLAATLAGVYVAPVATTATPGELAPVVAQSGATLVVTAEPVPPAVAATGVEVRLLDDLVAERREPPPADRPAGGLRPFTSGTTGTRKMVRLPPSGMTPQLRAAWDAATSRRIGVAGPGRHLVTGQPHQLASLTTALIALHAGQTLVMLGEWSPLAAMAALREHQPETAFFVPSMFAGLLALPDDVRATGTPRGLRAVVHSTAACPVATKKAMLDWWGPVLYERYGAAEAAGTYVTPAEWLARPGTVGKPFPGVRVAVLDAAGAPCAPYQPGLVHLTDSGFEYGDDSAPHSRGDGLVSLGDVGYLDEDGWLFLVGRETDYVSVGGAKFHPGDVEEVLAAHPAVAECAVVPVPHAVLGQVPIAYVVARSPWLDDPAGTASALHVYARETLPRERRPLRWRLVGELPRTASDKVDRRALTERARATSTAADLREPPPLA